ncbi:MAG: hypothetical protein VKL42_21920 [Snowella sp.]|nr:hypothetical protein [Snowella sp.]
MFLEKDNPPFTVEQLMAKIREEIAKQQSKNTEVKPPSSFAIIPNISHPVHPNLSGKRLATVANWDTCGAARETRRVKSLVWQRLQQKEKRQDTL